MAKTGNWSGAAARGRIRPRPPPAALAPRRREPGTRRRARVSAERGECGPWAPVPGGLGQSGASPCVVNWPGRVPSRPPSQCSPRLTQRRPRGSAARRGPDGSAPARERSPLQTRPHRRESGRGQRVDRCLTSPAAKQSKHGDLTSLGSARGAGSPANGAAQPQRGRGARAPLLGRGAHAPGSHAHLCAQGRSSSEVRGARWLLQQDLRPYKHVGQRSRLKLRNAPRGR